MNAPFPMEQKCARRQEEKRIFGRVYAIRKNKINLCKKSLFSKALQSSFQIHKPNAIVEKYGIHSFHCVMRTSSSNSAASAAAAVDCMCYVCGCQRMYECVCALLVLVTVEPVYPI